MPTDLQDTDVGGADLIFPDGLTGLTWSLRETSVYQAEEVQNQIGSDGTPEYGRWLPAIRVSPGSTRDKEEIWINAPGELIEELQDMTESNGDLVDKPATLSVTRCEKVGNSPTAPYEVNLERVDDVGEQKQIGE
jgi:hypothetical protein